MSTAINPQHLLTHAQELVDHHVGAGRPRAVLLRRAVSAAYYALFHDLATRTSRQVLPNGSDDEQLALCRSIDHSRVKEVCAWVSGQPGAGREHVRSLVVRMRGNIDVVQVADVFVQLQAKRPVTERTTTTSKRRTGQRRRRRSRRRSVAWSCLSATSGLRTKKRSSRSSPCTRSFAESLVMRPWSARRWGCGSTGRR